MEVRFNVNTSEVLYQHFLLRFLLYILKSSSFHLSIPPLLYRNHSKGHSACSSLCGVASLD